MLTFLGMVRACIHTFSKKNNLTSLKKFVISELDFLPVIPAN
jgi:hypothetical protein